MESNTSTRSSNSSSSAQKTLISLLKKDDVKFFTVSESEIEETKAKSRIGELTARQEQVTKFIDMLQKRQLPTDISFARVLTALRKLDRAGEAIEIFNIISQNLYFISKKKRVIGAWTYAALLEILEKRTKHANEDQAKQADIVAKAQEIWQVCEQIELIDSYIVTNMMGIYKEAGKLQDAIGIFDTYKSYDDLDMYNKCMNIFTWSNEIEKALSLLEKMKQIFRKSRKGRRDYGNMRIAYNSLIIIAFRREKNLKQALQLFEDGTKLGIYPVNQMQADNRTGMLILNFHLSREHRKEEGGLPLDVSKVAFLYFMQQVKNNEIHLPAKLITGGHIEEQDKLKQELPKYLQDEYGVEINWNLDPKMLEFVIPYASLRKIRFINDVREYINSQQGLFSGFETAFRELKQRYRADLRRASENRSDKHFLEKLKIPTNFRDSVREFAKNGESSFRARKYKEAEQLYRKIIKVLPKHPWAFVQVGWVLHRIGSFDEAINEYNKAKELNTAHNDDAKKLQSEIHRRLGWAYDRKHRQDEKEDTLTTAIQHYRQALQLNSTNYEIYNNWGIGLYRTKQYREAIQKFEIVRQNKPEHDEACVHLGDCYRKLGEFSEAEMYYNEAIERSKKFDSSKSAGWAYCRLAKLYCQQYEASHSERDFNASRDAFKQCLKLQPKCDQAYMGLAKLHEIKGNKEQVFVNRKKAEEITPRREDLINKGKKGTEGASSTSSTYSLAPNSTHFANKVSKKSEQTTSNILTTVTQESFTEEQAQEIREYAQQHPAYIGKK